MTQVSIAKACGDIDDMKLKANCNIFLRLCFAVVQVFRVLAFINVLRFPLNGLGQSLKCVCSIRILLERYLLLSSI